MSKEAHIRTLGILVAALITASPVLAGQVDAGAQGVVAPRVISSVQPSYTEAAMRARIEGTVVLGAVVHTDGTAGEITIVRSLDSTNGLDEQAIKALRQWKFEPGTLKGKPVAVRVRVEMDFNLRRSREEPKQ